MADTKFTEGPWSYDEERKHIVVQGDYDVCSLDIGWDEDSEQEIEEMYATAHLIAAAPELYALAEAFGDDSISDAEFNHMRHAALAKARGEAV